MAVVICEYGTGQGGTCEDQQQLILGYCPDRVRVLCAMACSRLIMNGGKPMDIRRMAQLMQTDQPMLGQEQQEE